ncbi:MAG: carboxypeptidase-like regulatory domain-containing protein [Chlorobi bacterium]|nr:carboxypeptidase-like regulatory domain-containing protein [Chlorobiota bacterium]
MLLLRQSITILLFFVFSFLLSAQGIRGRVVDGNGAPVPYTTIYLKKTTTGTTTNEFGYYEINLEPGIYDVVYQAMGYERKEFNIEVKDGFTVKDVTLHKQDIRLKEVKVYSGGEDPAYPVMRKAIALAPYYLRQVGHYESEVYLKGTLIMKNIPRLLSNKMEVDGQKIKEGETYTVESLNEITFDAPDKYDHKVLSFRSTFPGNDDGSPMGYITSSFYSPNIGITISPLAPNAFSHYRFRYLGFMDYGDVTVNIIQVIPRRKSQQLFRGKIYIVDGLWNLYSVDLINEAFFGTYHIKQVYAPVKEKVWLPVNHFIDIDASVFGIKAEFKYTGAVKYSNIRLNRELPVPDMLMQKYAEEEKAKTDTLKAEAGDNKLSKNQKKMEELLAKEELTNRDMIKLSRLIEKEAKTKEDDESLEVVSNYKLTVKKDSVKRDSAFWNSMRPIPLTKDELHSFEVRDSVLQEIKAEKSDTTGRYKKRKFNRFMGGFLWGGTHYVCDSSLRIRYDGLFNWKALDFNAVDGWSYKQSGRLRYKIDSLHGISFSPFLKYAFDRNKLYWDVNVVTNFAVKRRGVVSVSFGQQSRDFNRYYGIDRTLNMFSALFFKDHFMKLYGDDQLSLTAGIDIAHGLRLTAGTGFHRYTRLYNITDYSFFRKDEVYASNTPDNPQVTDAELNSQRGFNAGVSLSYTPRLKYRMYKGRKIMLGSKYPTFTVSYKAGLKSVFNSVSDFGLVSAKVNQKREWGVFSSFKWSVEGGYFTGNKQMHFSEFYHFNTSQIPVMFRNWDESFVLLEDYRYSTNDKFITGHLTYTSPYLALKYLPFFSNRLWLENLYARYLTQPSFKNYTEFGYGISQIFFMGSAGVFVGFEDGKYSRWGFRVAFKFD